MHALVIKLALLLFTKDIVNKQTNKHTYIILSSWFTSLIVFVLFLSCIQTYTPFYKLAFVCASIFNKGSFLQREHKFLILSQ